MNKEMKEIECLTFELTCFEKNKPTLNITLVEE